ncbi:MAG: ribosomal RNA small subunit methyltransferase A [Candidatus Omnitrophica bacterium]|nr:ribosomal RNA small subunit methyltransferase A [Candidatus Omnitrophota bacterium]
MTARSRRPGPAPKKSFGQNFLISPAVRDRILRACDVRDSDTVVEIGPGKGVLSKPLSGQAGRLFLVEKDPRMAAYLREELAGQPVTISETDILTYALPPGEKIILVGNIPYNISTPIVEYAIAHRSRIRTFFLTVQREFGERLAATPGSKIYGSLSVFAQFYADIKILFSIKRTAFFPVPKVDSCFVRMDFRSPRFRLPDESRFFRFVQQTFTQRRKTLINAMPYAGPKEELRNKLCACRIKPEARAETLAIEDFVRIFRRIDEAGD